MRFDLALEDPRCATDERHPRTSRDDARVVRPLAGKVAIVTGPLSGYGVALACSLAAAGASIVVNADVDDTVAAETVTRIGAAGGEAIAVPTSATKASDVTRLFDAALATFGTVDILVRLSACTPLPACDDEDDQRHRNATALRNFLVTREAVRHFGPKGGCIVNIGPTRTTLDRPAVAVYTV